MRKLIVLMLAVGFLLGALGTAFADKVQVFEPLEQGMSQRELRDKAQAQGFAQAVLDEAKVMLGSGFSEERAALLKEYFMDHAQPFIQGYKVVSAQDFPEGVSLTLDVRVDRKTLRDSLGSMGLFATLSAPQAASVTWPEGISDEDMLALQHLISLTGITPTEGATPAFTLEYGDEKGTYKARLSYDGQEWIAINRDMAQAWFTLWPRFFSRTQAQTAKTEGESLTVSGWFSPDGVLEFDRVLRGWDAAVQATQLVEMDMQPTGAGATWTLRVVNRDRLEMLLNSFLPQRGLSFHLAGKASE